MLYARGQLADLSILTISLRDAVREKLFSAPPLKDSIRNRVACTNACTVSRNALIPM